MASSQVQLGESVVTQNYHRIINDQYCKGLLFQHPCNGHFPAEICLDFMFGFFFLTLGS